MTDENAQNIDEGFKSFCSACLLLLLIAKINTVEDAQKFFEDSGVEGVEREKEEIINLISAHGSVKDAFLRY